MRQTSAVPPRRKLRCSVVCVGVDQVRWTALPLRNACRSVTGLGNSSDGGMGTPGLPQAVASMATKRQLNILICRKRIQFRKRVTERCLMGAGSQREGDSPSISARFCDPQGLSPRPPILNAHNPECQFRCMHFRRAPARAWWTRVRECG